MLTSFQLLHELAKEPFDLAKKGNLSPERVREFSAKGLGLTLLYGTERVTERIMGGLFAVAEEARCLEKMGQMQRGEVLNCIQGYESENRRVLHTAMRDFFDQRQESPAAKEAASLAYEELEKLKKFLEQAEREGYTTLIQIGIGGSELGPKAIYMGLKAFQKKGRKVYFLSNVDPDDAAAVLQSVDLQKTLIVVVSKSGTTLETETNEEFIREKLQIQGLDPINHMIAVTGKGSPMDDGKRYRASFYIWDYIGGRYSVTSMVGAVAIAFALGMDKFLEFLRGASAMDKLALERDMRKNLPLLNALLGVWNRNFLGHDTCAIIPYSQAMARFSAHLQQLDMESNGKRIDREGGPVPYVTGPIIWGEPGTNGQHSFYQLLHQGTTVVPIQFIGFAESQYGVDISFKGTTSQEKLLSNLFAQSIGLATGKESDNPNKVFPGNRPNRVLFGRKCDPFTLGAILSYYEHTVAFQGFIWNINSFDQEGVQLGKVLANQIIDLFQKKKGSGKLDPKEFPLAQAYLSMME